MSAVIEFESREAKINKAIESEVASIRAKVDYALPENGAPIVKSYIQKIEGTYDVSRAKRDTDNAIDLLYIAYNATPQEEGDIRVKISVLMKALIKSQQESELVMRRAMSIAEHLIGYVGDEFGPWRDLRKAISIDNFDELSDVQKASISAKVRSFIDKKLLPLVKKIQEKATAIQLDLERIARQYETIIEDTVAATSKGEIALAKRLNEHEAMLQEINEANARREQLESLVNDLKAEVEKFEKMAAEYEKKADTAEERSFIMSIINVGAQVVSAIIPPIALMAGGGAFLAGSKNRTDSSQPVDSSDSVDAKKAAQLKSKVSEQEAKLSESEKKTEELKTNIEELEAEKDKLKTKDEDVETSSETEPDETSKDKDEPSGDVQELEKRIESKKAELEKEEKNAATLKVALDASREAFDVLDKKLTALAAKQEEQGNNLRKMQMEMIGKAEAYEKERRTQAAELTKINALLVGKRSADEKIQLAIKSLNLSLSAMKRTKEIIEEVAFFFKSFAAFMQQVAEEAAYRKEAFENAVADDDEMGKYTLAKLIQTIDGFFIKQTAEWSATLVVSDKFCKSFAEGWSKLNNLSGDYKSGDRLTAYLVDAADRINVIAAERQEAADRKLADLEQYRNQLNAA